MTYLSQLLLNPQRRASRKLFASAQAMHAAVLSCFAPDVDPGRVLWRLDSQHPSHRLYVLSGAEPDFSHLQESAGWASSPGQSASMERLLASLDQQQLWAFRLAANPVRRLPLGPAGRRGKLVPHVTVEQQKQWLIHKGPQWGFEVLSKEQEQYQLLVSKREHLTFPRKNPLHPTGSDRVTLRRVQFDGVLRIQDADLLRQSLQAGLGRAKSYGCGLLTLRSL